MMMMSSSSSGLKGYLIRQTVYFLIKINYLKRKTKYFALQWLPVALSLGLKRPGLEADHLHLVPRSRMHEAIPPLPQYVFIV
jgi:hypothetical protein